MKFTLIIPLFFILCLYLFFAAKSGKLFKTVTTSAAVGIGSYIAVHIAGGFLGFILPLNIYGLSFCAFFGLPATAALMLINIII